MTLPTEVFAAYQDAVCKAKEMFDTTNPTRLQIMRAVQEIEEGARQDIYMLERKLGALYEILIHGGQQPEPH